MILGCCWVKLMRIRSDFAYNGTAGKENLKNLKRATERASSSMPWAKKQWHIAALWTLEWCRAQRAKGQAVKRRTLDPDVVPGVVETRRGRGLMIPGGLYKRAQSWMLDQPSKFRTRVNNVKQSQGQSDTPVKVSKEQNRCVVRDSISLRNETHVAEVFNAKYTAKLSGDSVDCCEDCFSYVGGCPHS